MTHTILAILSLITLASVLWLIGWMLAGAWPKIRKVFRA